MGQVVLSHHHVPYYHLLSYLLPARREQGFKHRHGPRPLWLHGDETPREWMSHQNLPLPFHLRHHMPHVWLMDGRHFTPNPNLAPPWMDLPQAAGFLGRAAWCLGRVILCTIKSLQERWQSGPASWQSGPADSLCGIGPDHLLACFDVGATFWEPAYMLAERRLRGRSLGVYPGPQDVDEWRTTYPTLFEWLARVQTGLDSQVSPLAGVFASVIAVLAEVLGRELGGTLYAISHQMAVSRRADQVQTLWIRCRQVRRELVCQFADALVGSWMEARDQQQNKKDMVKFYKNACSACPYLKKSGSVIKCIFIIFGATERGLRRSRRLQELGSVAFEQPSSVAALILR